jgi:hypothetical protein
MRYASQPVGLKFERLRIVPLEPRELNDLVAKFHRHHKPVAGHRFSIGVMDGERLAGGASIGRPVARMTCPKTVVEVTRLVTDGTPNACSMLYAAAARIAKALGYQRIQTFILADELGTSLRTAGWIDDGVSPGGDWARTRPRRQDQPQGAKRRYVRVL